MSYTLTGGRLFCPKTNRNDIADIHLEQGKILAIGPAPIQFKPEKTLSLNGQYVFPGLVDLCARFREPGQLQKGSLASESKAAVANGITTVCIPPDTNPSIDSPEMAEKIIDKAKKLKNCRIFPIGALTTGLGCTQITDLVALKEAGCIAFSNANQAIIDLSILRHCYDFAASFDYQIIIYPENAFLSRQGVAHEGSVAAILGLPGIPEAAETSAIAEHLLLIEATGVKAHFSGISTAKGVEMIGVAQASGLPVTLDVPMHHLLLNEQDLMDFNRSCYLKPPLRTQVDQLRLIEAAQSGHIQALSSFHQPHEKTALLAPFGEAASGLSALDTFFRLGFYLVQQKKLSLEQLILLTSTRPAQIMGLPTLGSLAIGSAADLFVFDPTQQTPVTPQHWVSQGKNSPFMGCILPGKVTACFVEGRLAFS